MKIQLSVEIPDGYTAGVQVRMLDRIIAKAVQDAKDAHAMMVNYRLDGCTLQTALYYKGEAE